MLFELHVAHNIATQRSRRMRQRRTAEAGIELFGDGGAARLRSALEHQRLVSGPGQVEGGNQPIMSAADDDDVAVRCRGSFFGHGLGRSLEVFKNFESSQPTRSAHDAAARMRRRPAHIKILDGRTELRPARHRPQEEELFQ